MAEMEADDVGGSSSNSIRAVSTHPQGEASVWENLSPCLLEHILLKLPVDSLVRFRTVSREWNELLRSQEFLKRHEIARQSEGPWILSFFEWSSVGGAYISSRESWRRVNLHGMEKISWCQGLLSDGGLICYNSNVVNPLTCSTRRLIRPLPSSQLKLSAFKVDRTTGFYKVFLLAKDHLLLSRRSYDYLLIYDSREDSWRRTENAPTPLDVENQGVILDGCIYFVMHPSEISVREDLDLQMMYYDLKKDEWGSCAISQHRRGLQWERKLHQWEDGVYLVSMSRKTCTVYVDEIRVKRAQCQTMKTMFRGDFEDLLADELSDFSLHDVSACGNLIIVFVDGRATQGSCNAYFHMVMYDLRTQKWSSAKDQLSSLVRVYNLMGFEPKLSVVGFEPRLSIAA